MILLGNFLLAASLILLAYSGIAAALRLGLRNPAWGESAIRAFYTATAAVGISSGILLHALLTCDFRLEYVANYSSTTLPRVYQLTAFWAGQSGSLLLWLLLLCVFTSLALAMYRRRLPEQLPLFLILSAFTSFFFNLVLLVFDPPFAVLDIVIEEGRGLNPLLQNAGMIFHPPALFFGYVGFTIPFALGLAGFVTGRQDRSWWQAMHRWSVFSWIFLTTGIILGAQWAYVELGWGGYWKWDPVENASFIPWLAGTAFLHTFILQNRTGVLRRWNILLASLTFLLCITGTFITRSGFIESIHAFARSFIGYYFLAFIFLMLGVTIFLLCRRPRGEQPPASRPDLSKEGLVMLTHLLFLGFMLVVLWGTLFPAFIQFFTGRQFAIKEGFFNQAVIPFGLLLLLLLALCPLLAWRRATNKHLGRILLQLILVTAAGAALTLHLGGKRAMAALLAGAGLAAAAAITADFFQKWLVRRRLTGESWLAAGWRSLIRPVRRRGADLIHLGTIMLCLGIIGSSYFSTVHEAAVQEGGQFQAGPFRFEYLSSQEDSDREKYVLRALLRMTGPDGLPVMLRPEKHLHRLFDQQPMTEVAIHTTLTRDVYVIFQPLSAPGKASFQVLINPGIIWIWLGGIFMVLGGLVAMLPVRRDPELRQALAGEAR